MSIGIIIVVVLVVGVAFVGIVAAVAIPSLLAARRASNESATIGTLRSLGSAEAIYFADTQTYGSFQDLRKADLIDEPSTNGALLDGYRFTIISADEDGFEIKAEPDKQSNGTRSFNITEDYTIRYKEGSTAPRGEAGTALRP